MASEPLLTMLRQLPPSKELLDFYHKKLQQYCDEESKWLQRLSEARRASNRSASVERRLVASRREVSVLQKGITDMKNALNQERKINLRLQSENDKLRIQELENRRKVLALLELCGKSDDDVTKLLDDADKLKQRTSHAGAEGIDAFVPQRLVDFMEKAKRDPSRFAALRRTAESSRLEILSLENQLMEQEKCHLDQISDLENERRLAARDREAERSQYERRITELSQSVNSLEEQLQKATEELVTTRTQHRKEEKALMSDKEVLMRKLQFLKHYGGPSGWFANLTDPASNTEQRSELRRGGEIRLHRDLQKLNTELAEQKQVTEEYRTQLLSMEAEVESMKEQSRSQQDSLKLRTKAMVEQVEAMRQRFNSLENRRRKEAEGYQTDVNILAQKLKQVEQKLIRASLAKAKEHDYIKTINEYERQVEKLKRSLRATGHWIT